MGRKKIAIKPIQSAASRRATFEKRRIGLLKKAMELSILCECTISVSIERKIEKDLQIYASEPFDEIIDKYQQFDGTYRLLTNDHLEEMVPGKMSSNQVGYHVRKRAEATISNPSSEAAKEHYAFQRSQVNPSRMISNMEIVPSLPSPNLDNLYSQLQRDVVLPSPHPSFNGYNPNSRYHQSQFQFQSNEIPPPPPTFTPPTFNHINNNNKRSFAAMNHHNHMPSMHDISAAQPALKRFKIENTNRHTSNTSHTLNTSNTSTIDGSDDYAIPSMSFSHELSPPAVHPLELQINQDIGVVKFE